MTIGQFTGHDPMEQSHLGQAVAIAKLQMVCRLKTRPCEIKVINASTPLTVAVLTRAADL